MLRDLTSLPDAVRGIRWDGLALVADGPARPALRGRGWPLPGGAPALGVPAREALALPHAPGRHPDVSR
ncbi:hypothetical protein SAZ_33370 [Streptomyces noursei ZPM]|uniref:Uncharacterized protein n=1 Tax=Streptomyces noursei TaxID=1971 RepID=A0A401RAA3_STRNR|nr:hypothetical protein [Streptomyces noursei]AKA09013.1 hypothetical protein SAZ_33370 [Streptomyces noursei ZPM]EOT03500.1 hypothetical protein K530_13324 [Streptomyces noursei CCRC 11814]EXU92693.1 hypothetical protein P354_15935 [Streptomyces noursei PD-1]UWS75294.1 hypothetical protein N1H47_31120 [Streptomyces noursei]GCB94579.1 hypothetical protein SALB_07379 [Streptomyces noursei]